MDKKSKLNSLKRRLKLTVYISIVVLAVLTLALLIGINQIEVNHRNANKSADILSALDLLISNIDDSIQTQREFLLTGKDELLTLYNSKVNSVREELNALDGKFQFPSQSINFDKLADLIELNFEQLDSEINIKQNNDSQGINEPLIVNTATDVLSEIVQTVEAIKAEDTENFKKNVDEFINVAIFISFFMLTSLLSSAIMVLYLGRRIRKESKAKEQLSKNLTDKNSELENKNRDYQKVAKELQSHNTELQDKTAELERLNEVMEGRDLKLAELEQEVEKLKNNN